MRTRQQRGSALITAAALTVVILLAVGGLMYYASQERTRAINVSRGLSRLSCAEDGLQLARAYYGQNYINWNTFLTGVNSYIYDPTATAPLTPANPWAPSLQAAHPELFVDLDGDGAADVYLYIRDNADELPPAGDNRQQDNDQNVIVGAVCISNTLVPHRQDGTSEETAPIPNALTMEGLLSYIDPGTNYCSQAYGCGLGHSNQNQ